MVASVIRNWAAELTPEAEAFAADLAHAAYEIALHRGISGPFADLELALWQQMREAVYDRAMEPCLTTGDAA